MRFIAIDNGDFVFQMGFLQNHQRSAVTEIVNDCCAEGAGCVGGDAFMESQLGRLMEAIRVQKDFTEPGPIEAARAMRKKLKYGSQLEQANALCLLDLLVVNGGPKLEKLYTDDKLLDRLQVVLLAEQKDNVSPKIQRMATQLMESWDAQFGQEPEMAQLVTLYRRCRKGQQKREKERKQRRRQKERVPDFMNDEAADDELLYYGSDAPKTNAQLDKQFKIPKINMQKEKPKILDLIARANVQSTNLGNALNSLAADELAIHSAKANKCFDECRSTRRIILRYLQLVSQEDLLGPLLKCNDDLVAVLKRYEEKSRSADDGDYDDDSIADLESYAASSFQEGAGVDSDDNDDYYVRRTDKYPPGPAEESEEEIEIAQRRPPPVPPKKSVLKEQKIDYTTASLKKKPELKPKPQMRSAADDYNPFSDDNEVAPSSWN